MTCMYCDEDDRLQKVMVKIKELEHTKVYLWKDNHYPGRCIVAWKEHVVGLDNLDADQRRRLMQEVFAVHDAIKAACEADNVQIGYYSDDKHVHMSVVPKRQGEPDWGRWFEPVRETLTFMSQPQIDQWSVEILKYLTQPEK